MDFVDPSVRAVYEILDLIGVVLYGMIGAMIARSRNLDVIGVVFLAIITALGGGMIRDLLIDNGPPAAMQDPRYFGMALLGALVSLLIHMNSRSWEVLRVHGDAVVLGVWAAVGSSKALANDLPWSSALFLGVLTVVGGGMIRDVMTGSVPAIFGGATLYATPAALTAAIMVALDEVQKTGVTGDFPLILVGLVVAPCIGAGVMIAAYWRGWVLPGTQNLSWAAQRKLRQPMTLARDMSRQRLRLRRRRADKIVEEIEVAGDAEGTAGTYGSDSTDNADRPTGGADGTGRPDDDSAPGGATPPSAG